MSTQAYRGSAATSLSNIKHATRSLLEKGTRKDTPTGRTPRKRLWEYPDHWELTKPRDDLVREWKAGRGEGTVSSGVQRHFPLVKLEDNERETLSTEVSLSDREDMEVDEKLEDEGHALGSPTLSSAGSSSYSLPALPQQVHKSTGANGFGQVTKIPGIGPPNALKERSINVLPPRVSKRRR